ncbi:MAG: RtcB family protein [Firmicutes bacterium]|nr:RtcB family protein [Bacillota bacterium]
MFLQIEKCGLNCYRIPRQGEMKVEARVYLNEFLYENYLEEESLEQLCDAASLPGVYRYVIGMPDIHSGYGLPIGGVMAMEVPDGLISAGAVGMDINCGVRLLRTNIGVQDLDKKDLEKLLREIAARVPTGIGKTSKHQADLGRHFAEIVESGFPVLLELGYARPEDRRFVEEEGFFPGANLSKVSNKARKRGNQLSTIGGGNHFIELGEVAEIFDRENAALFGLTRGSLSVLIHTGSRGFGHQICVDYSSIMEKSAKRYGLKLPSRGLAAVPIESPEGKDYFAAMSAAINFAFANRQIITHDVREAFGAYFDCRDTELDLGVVYDVAHNIAKFEEVEGRELLIHRKGATRALPPQHRGNPSAYRSSGHPVFIPGSMGTSSYIIVATPKVVETFYSVNHGAGRVMSRREARRQFDVEMLREQLGPIVFYGDRERNILDEAPQAYKDIDAVVDTLAEIGIIKKVARLSPLAVVKGGKGGRRGRR